MQACIRGHTIWINCVAIQHVSNMGHHPANNRMSTVDGSADSGFKGVEISSEEILNLLDSPLGLTIAGALTHRAVLRHQLKKFIPRFPNTRFLDPPECLLDR